MQFIIKLGIIALCLLIFKLCHLLGNSVFKSCELTLLSLKHHKLLDRVEVWRSAGKNQSDEYLHLLENHCTNPVLLLNPLLLFVSYSFEKELQIFQITKIGLNYVNERSETVFEYTFARLTGKTAKQHSSNSIEFSAQIT